MQKSSLFSLVREEVIRGLVFGGTFFVIVVSTLASVAHAADGGLFGGILAKILGITPANVLTYNGDGTVANAYNLGGTPANQFQKLSAPNQSCGANQCIYAFDTSGNILCR